GSTGFIVEKRLSLCSVRNYIGEQWIVVRQDDHKIAPIGRSSRVADKIPIAHAWAILRHGPRDHDDAVRSPSCVRDSFHRDTPVVEISGKFHDHVRTCKRKEEPSDASRGLLMLQSNYLCYFILRVDDVLLLEYTEGREGDVLEYDSNEQGQHRQLAPQLHLCCRETYEATEVQHGDEVDRCQVVSGRDTETDVPDEASYAAKSQAIPQ